MNFSTSACFQNTNDETKHGAEKVFFNASSLNRKLVEKKIFKQKGESEKQEGKMLPNLIKYESQNAIKTRCKLILKSLKKILNNF